MHGDVVGNDSEDEEFLDRAEEFEKAYNFRFEVSLALFVPSSCRRTVLQLISEFTACQVRVNMRLSCMRVGVIPQEASRSLPWVLLC